MVAQIKAFPTKKLLYYILGLLEVLLAFRLGLKLLGANPQSGFVAFIYNLSKIFVYPFWGIFRPIVTEGIETASILEPATIMAMIVYAIIAYGIARLLELKAH